MTSYHIVCHLGFFWISPKLKESAKINRKVIKNNKRTSSLATNSNVTVKKKIIIIIFLHFIKGLKSFLEMKFFQMKFYHPP